MPRTPHSPRTTAAGALAAALILLSATPALGQDVAKDGTLLFQPDRPTAGETVEATYRPLPDLRGSPRLHLRARERTRDDESYNDGMGSRAIAVLEPTEDGAYRGRFRLPDDVVYAAFAVEDPAATMTDSRGGELWELLAHEDGRPLFAALVQRFNDHMGRDQRVVLETARDMARLYPDTVQAWSLLRSAESWVMGPDGAEDRAEEHRRRAARFDAALRDRPDLDTNQVGYLYWYASGELRDHWRARLLREHPGHFFAIQEQVMAKRRALQEEPEVLLQDLDELWNLAAGDQARGRIVGPAFQLAVSQDPELARIWGDRWVALSPGARINVLLAMAGEGARPAVQELDSVIQDLEAAADSARPLGATMAEHRDDHARRAATLRAALGEVLLAAGREEEAAVNLRRAAAVGWDTQRHLRLGDALLATGDTADAVEALAAAAVDPALSEADADSLRARVSVSTERWVDAMAAAREEMRRRTLARAQDRPLGAVQVADPRGRRSDLRGLLGEEATVVAIWSRYCGYSVNAMPDVVALGQRLAAEGVPLLAITGDDPEQAAAYLDEAGLDPTVWYDLDGEVARSLNSWGTPQYFVLDRDGHLRFAYSSLADLPRQVWALREN